MRTHERIDFDELMRHLMVVGFAALAIWTLVSSAGLALGMVTISTHATLRFLLAVLILVFSRRTYWELREWHWRRYPPDERYGFADRIPEHARAAETAATESQQPHAGEEPPRR
ncbi:MAG TPA: hypothetical protein VFA25_01295 [Actinomycetota bacterium]|jgi:hypothetical protein|nr:hypothetical protein [Actinomycetota bacterium]